MRDLKNYKDFSPINESNEFKDGRIGFLCYLGGDWYYAATDTFSEFCLRMYSMFDDEPDFRNIEADFGIGSHFIPDREAFCRFLKDKAFRRGSIHRESISNLRIWWTHIFTIMPHQMHWHSGEGNPYEDLRSLEKAFPSLREMLNEQSNSFKIDSDPRFIVQSIHNEPGQLMDYLDHAEKSGFSDFNAQEILDSIKNPSDRVKSMMKWRKMKGLI